MTEPCTKGVSCGIPDFRSRTGLYAMLQEKGEYDLDDPQQMYVESTHCDSRVHLTQTYRFDIDYFKENPSSQLNVLSGIQLLIVVYCSILVRIPVYK